jgi:3-mercaptopyruvate sulfurtransferase SseA
VALQMKKAGIGRVRPLAGGLERWRALGYPTEPVELPAPDNVSNVSLNLDADAGI